MSRHKVIQWATGVVGKSSITLREDEEPIVVFVKPVVVVNGPLFSYSVLWWRD